MGYWQQELFNVWDDLEHNEGSIYNENVDFAYFRASSIRIGKWVDEQSKNGCLKLLFLVAEKDELIGQLTDERNKYKALYEGTYLLD